MKQSVKDTFFTVAGAVILAFGTSVFILPYNLIIGGVSGIAIIIGNISASPFLSEEITVSVLTWALFFLGLFAFGRRFAKKTLISSLLYPLAVSLFLKLGSIPATEEFFNIRLSSGEGAEIILAAIFGGVFVGTGCALTFLGGGSSGGVDILAFLLSRTFKRLRSSVAIFIIDAAIVLVGFLVLRNLALSLLGITSIFISTSLVDRIFLGSERSYAAEIITEREKEINEAVIRELERTTTIFDAVGGYSGRGMKMLKVSFKAREYRTLMNIIRRADSKAFINIYGVHEINGEGWTR